MDISLDMMKAILDKAESEGISGAEAFQDSGIKKEELVARMKEGDLSAAVLLLLGMVSLRYRSWKEEYEDEDTGETIWLDRKYFVDEFIYDSIQDEVHELEAMISSAADGLSDEFLRMCWNLFDEDRIPVPIVSTLADRNDVSALEWLGGFYGGFYSTDFLFPVDKTKAADYYRKALDAGLCREKFDLDLLQLECGLKWQDSIDWVFKSEGFRELEEDVDYDADKNWTIDDCWLIIIGRLFLDEFPSPVFNSMCDLEEQACTSLDLKKELVSRGVPESAFHESEEGFVVEMRNCTFCVKDGPVESQGFSGTSVSVSFPLCKGASFGDVVDFMEEETFSSESYADAMFRVDENAPAVRLAMRLVHDKLMKACRDKPRRVNETKAFLKRVFGGELPDGLFVRAANAYGLHEGGGDKYCRELVYVQYHDTSYELEIEYGDLNIIPEFLFKWFVQSIRNDLENYTYRFEFRYGIRIERGEAGQRLLVIQDTLLDEPLITPPESLTIEKLDAYKKLYDRHLWDS